MKKLLLAVVVLALVSGLVNTSFAEGKISIGIGGDLMLPLDSGFSNAYGIGFGGTGRGQYMVNEQFSAMLTTGFLLFTGKDIGGVKLDNATMIPILVGGKYYFGTGNMKFYGAADLGITIFKTSVSTPAIPAIPPFFAGSPGGSISASSSEFTFQPQVGFESALGSGTTKLDIGVRAIIISNAFSIGARVGVLFPVGS